MLSLSNLVFQCGEQQVKYYSSLFYLSSYRNLGWEYVQSEILEQLHQTQYNPNEG